MAVLVGVGQCRSLCQSGSQLDDAVGRFAQSFCFLGIAPMVRPSARTKRTSAMRKNSNANLYFILDI